jgi:enamine deaminase RidA (YjgF/YER057c/UK114 family)
MEHIIDPATAGFVGQWHFSHVVRSRGLLFLSGVTGTGTDGRVAEDPSEQSEQLFTHLRQYLTSAGASLHDLVEITTYHVDLQTHLRAFTTVKDTYLPGPYPAWSAIGVSQLITPGALVELRAIAEDPSAP